MATIPAPAQAIVFDAYGTLFDVYSVTAAAERRFPGHGSALAQLWRDRQIDYTRLRTLCDRYQGFWQCTQDALVFAARRLGLPLDDAAREQLMDSYRTLRAFDDVVPVLQDLRTRGHRLAILSNGDTPMLQSAVQAAGLGECFDHLLSVEKVRRFKTAPEAYALGPVAFGCPAGDIVFVSSNGWDACGATWFGYRTFWVNRSAQPAEELGVTPHGEGRTLHDLLTWLEGASPGPVVAR